MAGPPQQWWHRGNGRAHARDTCISRFCVVPSVRLSPSSQTARFLFPPSNCSHCLRKLRLHFGASLLCRIPCLRSPPLVTHSTISPQREESIISTGGQEEPLRDGMTGSVPPRCLPPCSHQLFFSSPAAKRIHGFTL